MNKLYLSLLTTILFVFSIKMQAQEKSIAALKKSNKHSCYFSWGYNTEWYTKSNVYVKQSDLGNDYKFNQVKAHDHKGWDEGIFNHQLTIPQYNYRIGYFLNEKKGWALELNFDHTKYIISEPQSIHITGKLMGNTIDSILNFNTSNGFYYYLNNGANFFLINLVKRLKIAETNKKAIRIDALGKIGIGPVVPHVENSLFGVKNTPHFQFGGWNTGIEGNLKVSFYKWVYLEYGLKLDYARYAHLQINNGQIHQAFGTFEMMLNLGINLP